MSVASTAPDRRIHNKSVRKLQTQLALPSILLPTAGMIACLVQVFTRGVGVLELSLLGGMYLLSMTGVSVGFHRYFAHRSFQAKRPVRALFAVLGSMGGQGPIINWVSNHRRHHAHSDEIGDPHSPLVTDEGKRMPPLAGFWHSHIGWMLKGDVTNAVRFSKDLLRDPMIGTINRLYPLWLSLSLLIPTVIGAAVRGSFEGAWLGFIWGGLFQIALTQHATWSIASLAHIFGTRPYETGGADTSRNNVVIAIPILGDGWHNNHHAFPSAAICGFEWWQIDPSGWVIRALAATGLAYQVNGVPSQEERAARRLRGAPATPSDDFKPARR